jgi:hypothetical protein
MVAAFYRGASDITLPPQVNTSNIALKDIIAIRAMYEIQNARLTLLETPQTT